MTQKRVSIGGRYLKRYKVRRFISSLVLIGLLVFVGLFSWWKWVTRSVGGAEQKMVVVSRGAAIDEIGQSLKQAGLIKSIPAFKLMVMKLGVSKKIQAGDFRLNGEMNLAEIVKGMTHGSLDVWITLPEGWRREQMAERLKGELPGFEAETFLAATADKEGYLFPDTYLIPKDVAVESVVSLLTNNFEKKVGQADKSTIILASIVEREAVGSEDRQLVADILTKRLAAGMGLNADATLQYAIGKPGNWWPVPLASDKKVKSAFNTYMYRGLPPAPIANPGLGSIRAVLGARETAYLYYLHDPEGKIHPAKTFEEHQMNIDKYL